MNKTKTDDYAEVFGIFLDLVDPYLDRDCECILVSDDEQAEWKGALRAFEKKEGLFYQINNWSMLCQPPPYLVT